MENQHRKIAGYRELSQAEIDLMNRIKEKGGELLSLQAELFDMLGQQDKDKRLAICIPSDSHEAHAAEFDRFMAAEPFRWAAIGKTDIQTGLMAMVRAVAQPAGV